MKTREQLIEIYESRINGNISVFNEEVVKLSTLDCLNMIECVTGQLGEPSHIIINSLRSAFEKIEENGREFVAMTFSRHDLKEFVDDPSKISDEDMQEIAQDIGYALSCNDELASVVTEAVETYEEKKK